MRDAKGARESGALQIIMKPNVDNRITEWHPPEVMEKIGHNLEMRN